MEDKLEFPVDFTHELYALSRRMLDALRESQAGPPEGDPLLLAEAESLLGRVESCG